MNDPLLRQPVQGRAHVVHFPSSAVVFAFAQAGAAKVEPHHGTADARQGLGALEDHLRVHRAALLRVRVGERHGSARRQHALERLSSPAGMLASARSENGQLVLEIPSLDLASYNRLALTIVRLDPYENGNASGHYALQVQIE